MVADIPALQSTKIKKDGLDVQECITCTSEPSFFIGETLVIAGDVIVFSDSQMTK